MDKTVNLNDKYNFFKFVDKNKSQDFSKVVNRLTQSYMGDIFKKMEAQDKLKK